jgi:hypothetical protein
MFVLSSLAQVFVSNNKPQLGLGAELNMIDGLLKVISKKKEIREESGSASPRLSSPMIVRIHRCAEGFIPVLTWSPRIKTTVARDAGNGPWLKNDMGFDKPLQGDSIYA